MANDDASLLPCPFCGGQPFHDRADYSSCYVICNDCSARGPVSCDENDVDAAASESGDADPGELPAKRLWNTRTTPTATQSGGDALATHLTVFERVTRLADTLTSDVPVTAAALGQVKAAYASLAALSAAQSSERFPANRLQSECFGSGVNVSVPDTGSTEGERWRPIAEADDHCRYMGAFPEPLQPSKWIIVGPGYVRGGVFRNHLGEWPGMRLILRIPTPRAAALTPPQPTTTAPKALPSHPRANVRPAYTDTMVGLLDAYEQAIWTWAQGCEVDGIQQRSTVGDSYNEGQRDDASKARSALIRQIDALTTPDTPHRPGRERAGAGRMGDGAA